MNVGAVQRQSLLAELIQGVLFCLVNHVIMGLPCALFQNDQQLDCALDLMRRLPPQQIEKNLSDLIDLVRYHLPGTVVSTCHIHMRTDTPSSPNTHTHTHE